VQRRRPQSGFRAGDGRGKWVALGQALKAAERHEEATKATSGAIPARWHECAGAPGAGRTEDPAGLRKKLSLSSSSRSSAARAGCGAPGAGMRSHCWDGMRRHWKSTAALRVAPAPAGGEFGAGFRTGQAGTREEGQTRYRRAVAVRPDLQQPGSTWGSFLLREQGQDVLRKPRCAALSSCGRIWFRVGHLASWSANVAGLKSPSAICSRRSRSTRRKLKRLVGRGASFGLGKDLPGAWGWLRWALALNPDFDEAVNLHGILLHLDGRFSEP